LPSVFDPFLQLAGVSSQAATSLVDLFENGRLWERRTALAGSIGVLVGGAIAITASNGYVAPYGVPGGITIGVVGLLALVVAVSSFDFHKAQAQTQAVTALEERVRAEPAEPQLAWDLARIKLESYLDRNLRQVSQIYYLTLFVMVFGMVLISVGIWHAINDPAVIQPAELAALAGVIVQVIGGTFLLIYRSTMSQAKDYVIVLERINAVGMSINILEGIESATQMRDDARVQLSTSLLSMYAPRSAGSSGKARKASKNASLPN
jgi:hypothetical protein